jgi:thiol-disulfide isomerase/thioredoxin
LENDVRAAKRRIQRMQTHKTFFRFFRRLKGAAAILCAAGIVAAVPGNAAAEPLPPALQRYAGKIIYLDFWASWCGPCAQSFPWLDEMQARYGKRMVILAVDVDNDADAARDFLSNHPATFAVVADPDGKLAERYHIEGMPSTVILDRTGRIVHQHSGFVEARADDYETAIRNAIADSPQLAQKR